MTTYLITKAASPIEAKVSSIGTQSLAQLWKYSLLFSALATAYIVIGKLLSKLSPYLHNLNIERDHQYWRNQSRWEQQFLSNHYSPYFHAALLVDKPKKIPINKSMLYWNDFFDTFHP